ncbi:IS1182 family transposase [Candidatus Saccharibacteria bacterium]|nr:IS1182 family transposase [Candidatus Saccharibacteria bacterium]
MAKYKRYDYKQGLMIAVSLEDQLMPGTLEFAIHTLVERRMDMSVFDANYQNDDVGRSAYDPKILLKVVLLGYSRGLTSSRAIERACCENVLFMAMSCNQRPDHSTIAAFVSSMKDQILPLFCDILLVCEQENLLGGTFFALDGVKLSSNASKESSGRISDLEKKKNKIRQKVKRLLKEQIAADKDDDDDFSGPSARERQIDKLQKQAARIESFLKQNDKKIGENKKELNSNVTDNDSAKMHTSHGMVQGYNAQAIVDSKHQVIVHGEAIGKGLDNANLPPVIDGAQKNLERIGKGCDYFEGKILTADSSYHSVTNIAKCNEENIDAYIPDNKFRNRDKRFASRVGYRPRSKKFTFADFKYDRDKNQYICPNGKRLKRLGKTGRHKGKLLKRYVSNETDCRGCDLRVRCLQNKDAKRRHFTYYVDASGNNISHAMVKKIETAKGRKIYPQRIGIVEPVFANIRVHKGMDKFSLRGKIKVNIQWLLYCMVHNIEKVANYGFT